MTSKCSSSAIMAAKAALRNKMKDVLKNMTPEDREKQSKIIFQKLIETNEWKSAKRISCYLSTLEEVHTDIIITEAFDSGKKCFVPMIRGGSMSMLKLQNMEDLNNLPKDSWGIRLPEPIEGRENAIETGGVDLIVVPGMAFTRDGKRLGHGKGYYDRFIKELKNINCKPKTYAVGFHQQVLEDVPVDDYDQIIDSIITADS